MTTVRRILAVALATLPLAFADAARAAPPGCQPVAFATTATDGEILSAETDCRHVDGAAGDFVRIRLIKTEGASFSPRFELRRPNGTTRCGPTSASEITCLLDATGTHTIHVRDYAGTNGGRYKLSIQRLNDPVGCGRLELSTTATADAIAPPDETDCWRVDGAVGDVMRVRAIKTGGASFSPRLELVRPNGSTRCGPASVSELACSLDASGTHTILLRDYAGLNAGQYKLSIQRLNDPVGCGRLEFSTTAAADAIEPPDETDCRRFDAAPGDLVRVRAIKTGGATFSPRLEVLRPNGSTRCGPTSVSDLTCSLDATGTHTVLVRDYSGLNPGQYKLSIQRLNDPVGCGRLEYTATPTTDAIAPPDETACWRFASSAGDVIRVRVTKTAGATFSPRVEVLRPNGTTRCGPTSGADFTCTLDAAGTHSALVRDYSGLNAGEYRISIELVSPPSAVRLVLEGEHGTGDGVAMPRSQASGLRTVWLHAGEVRRLPFTLPADGRYRLTTRFSNDNFGPLERVTLSVDGTRAGEFEARDTGDHGLGWNVFAEADLGSVELTGGAHELTIEVAAGDGYGVEIDQATILGEADTLMSRGAL